MAVSCTTGLEALLSRFLLGDPLASDEFPRVAQPFLQQVSDRVGRFLAPDQRKEIVQQAFLLLLTGKAGVSDPARGSAKAFLFLVMQRATREVAATYAAPGTQTRPPASAGGEISTAPGVISLEEMLMTYEPQQTGADLVAEHHCDTETVLARAPAGIAHALRRIYLEDAQIGDVATELRVTRFALRRRIMSFAESFAA